eukprot:569676-Amphidinium_carterae.1
MANRYAMHSTTAVSLARLGADVNMFASNVMAVTPFGNARRAQFQLQPHQWQLKQLRLPNPE